jgi:hypothetical protein
MQSLRRPSLRSDASGEQRFVTEPDRPQALASGRVKRLWDARVFGHTEGHDQRARGVPWLPGVLERLIRREDLSGEEAAAALLRSLGFEKVTVVFEQPPAT